MRNEYIVAPHPFRLNSLALDQSCSSFQVTRNNTKARLAAGRETRQISEFDAAALVIELGNANRPVADARRLFLQVVGPSTLRISGDPLKVRRLLQNLLLNAFKYTVQGGVTLSVGVEAENWWLMVQDTGPGLRVGSGTSCSTRALKWRVRRRRAPPSA
jgi:light-regulated signal transduction histidine kinase (bacteriophytochrome)